MKRPVRLAALPTPGLHSFPRRLPRLQPLRWYERWPPCATAQHREDPVWREYLREHGYDATRQLIEAQLREQEARR